MSPSTAAVLLLASSALAVPLVQRQDLPPDNAKDFDQICGHDDLSTFDLAEQTWEQTAAGYHIDSYIANVKGGNADDWVNNMCKSIQNRLGCDSGGSFLVVALWRCCKHASHYQIVAVTYLGSHTRFAA